MPPVALLPDFGPFEFWWNSDDHIPPHFHVFHTSGKWEVRVSFTKCTTTELKYDFKFPSTRNRPLKSAEEKAILNHMKNSSGSIMKRQLYNEWKGQVILRDNI